MRKLNMLAIASVAILGSSVAMAVPGPGMGQGAGMGQGMMQGNEMGYHHNAGKHHKGYRTNNLRNGMGAGAGMFWGINLTAEQQQKIQVIYYEGQAKMASMPRPSATDMGAYHNLVTADKFDEAQVRKQLETNTKSQIDRRVEMAKIHYDMYQVLTPEQKAQAQKNHETRVTNFNQRMNGAAGGWGMAGHNPNCPFMR